MKIDVQMKVDEDMNPDKSEVAAGWVEIEGCIKFPVKVRRYIDKIDQKEKMFVSYPQRKKGNDYENVVYPHDKKVREELEEKVLNTVWSEVRKGIELPDIENVRVSLLEQKQADAPIAVKGIATLKLAGMTINRILIKESQKGLFVQMPQYKADGIYKDTVYGTNTGIHALIKDEVLYAYKKELEHVQKGEITERPEQKQEEQTEPEQGKMLPKQMDKSASIESFFKAYAQQDRHNMIKALTNAELELDPAQLTADGSVVRHQSALLEHENRIDPAQEIPFNGTVKQKVAVDLFEHENPIGRQVITEVKSMNFKDAEKGYQDTIRNWKKLTKQENISFDKKEQQKQQNTDQEKKLPTPRI